MADIIVKFEKLDEDGNSLGFIHQAEKKFSDVTAAISYRNEILETRTSLELDGSVKKLTGHVCAQTNLDAVMFGYPILPHSDTKGL